MHAARTRSRPFASTTSFSNAATVACLNTRALLRTLFAAPNLHLPSSPAVSANSMSSLPMHIEKFARLSTGDAVSSSGEIITVSVLLEQALVTALMDLLDCQAKRVAKRYLERRIQIADTGLGLTDFRNQHFACLFHSTPSRTWGCPNVYAARNFDNAD